MRRLRNEVDGIVLRKESYFALRLFAGCRRSGVICSLVLTLVDDRARLPSQVPAHTA